MQKLCFGNIKRCKKDRGKDLKAETNGLEGFSIISLAES